MCASLLCPNSASKHQSWPPGLQSAQAERRAPLVCPAARHARPPTHLCQAFQVHERVELGVVREAQALLDASHFCSRRDARRGAGALAAGAKEGARVWEWMGSAGARQRVPPQGLAAGYRGQRGALAAGGRGGGVRDVVAGGGSSGGDSSGSGSGSTSVTASMVWCGSSTHPVPPPCVPGPPPKFAHSVSVSPALQETDSQAED